MIGFSFLDIPLTSWKHCQIHDMLRALCFFASPLSKFYYNSNKQNNNFTYRFILKIKTSFLSNMFFAVSSKPHDLKNIVFLNHLM